MRSLGAKPGALSVGQSVSVWWMGRRQGSQSVIGANGDGTKVRLSDGSHWELTTSGSGTFWEPRTEVVTGIDRIVSHYKAIHWCLEVEP